MKSKYTFVYNEHIEGLLDSVLQKMATQISGSDVCSLVEFVVFGGGYGRGEGGILRTQTEDKLYNDLDFFVLAKDTATTADMAKIDAFFANLSKEFEPLVEVDVDFSKAVKVSYAKARLNIMSWREMALGGNVVFGSQQQFDEVFQLNSDKTDVLFSEIVKLAMNRVSGLVFAQERLVKCANLSDSDCDFIARNINKALLASGDVLLWTTGNLPFKTASRLAELKTHSAEQPQWTELASVYERAVEFKKFPNIKLDRAEFEKNLSQAIEILKKAYEHFVENSKPDATLVRRIKDFILLLKLKKYFSKIGCVAINNPRQSLIFTAFSLLTDKANVSEEKISTYKEIWKRLA